MTPLELRRQLDYCPYTGVFTRAKSVRGKGCRKGDVAGCVNSRGYVSIKVFSKKYMAHRLAWLYTFGELPDQIDHINGVKSDNRICNLRNVSNEVNQRNKARCKRNTSGCTGVSYSKKDKGWHARISYNGKRISLGVHKQKSDAIAARKEAERIYGYHKNHDREVSGGL